MVNGTLINYYFHCKKQLWLHGNRINMEDNSEDVKIGKAIHEVKSEESPNSEISIENIKVDKITKDYLVEIKKSDADVEAVQWQVLYYLKVLKNKGIERKGKIEFIEKNKTKSKVIYVELDEENEKDLLVIEKEIDEIIGSDLIPEGINDKSCKKCAYYDFCYI